MTLPRLPLLSYFLAVLPREQQRRLESRFRHVRADLEFATWVPRSEVGHRAREAIQLGFTVWASVDQVSAFLYGAGAGMRSASRRALASWLDRITAPGQRGHLHVLNPKNSFPMNSQGNSSQWEFISRPEDRRH